MYDRNAIKVGIVSFFMLAILAGLLIWKSGIFYRLDGYEVIGDFPSVNGLVNGAEVRYRGSKVGKVFEIEPTPKSVRVHFRVESSIKIPKNSIVKIYFDGLIGEKFLNVVPNPTETEMMADGDVMQGTVSAGLAEFVELGAQNLEATKQVLQTYEKILNSPQMTESFQNTVMAFEKISRDMAVLSGVLAGSDPKSKGSIPQLLANLTQTTELVRQNTDLMLKDGQLASSSKAAIVDMATTAAQLKAMVTMMSQQLVSTSNVQKLNATLDNAYDISAGARGLIGTDASYGPVGALQAFSRTRMSGEAMVLPISTAPQGAAYQANFDSTLGYSFLRTGVTGLKSTDQQVVNLQFGTHWGGASTRLGYFYSQLGAGLDYKPTSRATLSVEMYNVDHPELDFKGKYKFSDHLGVVVNVKKNTMSSSYDNVGVGVLFTTGKE